MKRITIYTLLVISFTVSICTKGLSQEKNTVFRSLLNSYEESINTADTVSAAKIWSKSAEVSFINPMSTEYGWHGVKNIYKMFADTFSMRKLHGSGEKVSIYGDVAWLTFEWVFDATPRNNNQAIQTKGRETQVWKKEKGAWRLVHVHYSGLPMTGERF